MRKWSMIALGSLLASALVLSPKSSESDGFSKRTLRGGYGCVITGFQLQDPPVDPEFVWNLGNAVPGTILMRLRSNGKGEYTANFDFNVGGRFVRTFDDGPLPGTYTVSPDGTGTLDGGFYTFDFVLTENGRSLTFLTKTFFPNGGPLQQHTVDHGVCRKQ